MSNNQEKETYLFYDVESTGVDKYNDRIVQLAAVLTDDKGKELETYCTIIKPDDFEIPEGATAIHGISTERAIKEGVSLKSAIDNFIKIADRCTATVAHNTAFDQPFIYSEFRRLYTPNQYDNIADPFLRKASFCTMKSTTDFVKIGWNDYYQSYKWPKLIELHQKLFGEGFDGAHDALVDVRATIKCFFELKEKHGFFEDTDDLPF